MKQFFMLACIYALLLPLFTFAQSSGDFLPGYIIKPDGERIQGLVQLREHSFNTNTCVFKSSEMSPSNVYNPNSITGYGITDRSIYQAVSLDSTGASKFFAECIVYGDRSLFFYRDRYFMQSPAGQMVELISRQNTIVQNGKDYTVELPVYKATLQENMNNCSTIHESIRTTTLEKKSLTQLFVRYNKCVGEEPKVFEETTDKSGVHFGFSLGAWASSLKMKPGGQSGYSYVNRQPKPTDLTFSPSLWLQFSSNKRRVQLRTGATLYSGQYNISDEDVNANLRHELTIEVTTIEIPVQLKYDLLAGKTGLYLVGGVGLNTIIKWEDQEIKSTLSDFVLSENSDLDPNNFMINVQGGLNFELPLGNHAFFLEAIYGWNPLLIKSTSNSPTGTLTGLRFGAGLMF